jgi:hypothetical protein
MFAIISRRVVAGLTTEGNRAALPDLKYGYSALEPVISGKMLETHHKKHHQTYVNNLNAALDQFEGTSLPTQTPSPTSITTAWLLSVRQSSSTWEDTSTTPSTGKTWLLSARVVDSTLLRAPP